VEFLSNIDFDQLLKALNETLYMSLVSLFFATIIGLLVGILLYVTQTGGLYENKIVNRVVDVIVNILRAVPFIILMILVMPFTKMLVGTILGASAALPSLIIAAVPFYARLCVIAFIEVDRGTIEASKSMGASNWQIIYKVLLPESLPALVSGICVTGISLISYTAMAGAIGSGGLGNLAYLYGWVRRNNAILYVSTLIILIIVLVIQGLGDYLVSKIDKR
jgi:D-methionine transport system permease protein